MPRQEMDPSAHHFEAHVLTNNPPNVNVEEPKVGMCFPSTDDAYKFAERDQEAQRDQAVVAARDPAAQETLIFNAAARNPLFRTLYPRVSTFTPCFASTLYYVNIMDSLMCSTKRWTDNCMGWVPPYSQIYISVLLYIQTVRAMDASGMLMPSNEFSLLLDGFCKYFPLDSLWIPGPLVSAFKNLACFWPSATGLFGNVTPCLPPSPGWSQETRFAVSDPYNRHLPNISLFMSRLHSTCAAASRANTTQALFYNDVDGPRAIAHFFGQACDHTVPERALVASPGASLSYSGSLRLWQDASNLLPDMGMPTNLDLETDEVPNNWNSFLWFDASYNWLGPLAAMMARYCQFWKGSCPLSECSPNCSAAGAVRCTTTNRSDVFTSPTWTERSGTHSDHQRGSANQFGHYQTRQLLNLTFKASCTLKDIPDAHVFAALTYHFNMTRNQEQYAQLVNGPFWNVAPDTFKRSGIQVYEGVHSSIARDYHSDTRLDSGRQ